MTTTSVLTGKPPRWQALSQAEQGWVWSRNVRFAERCGREPCPPRKSVWLR